MTGLFTPISGRYSDQNVLETVDDGTALVMLVSPGNATTGNTYVTTLDLLATFFGGFPFSNTVVVTSGATIGSPYAVLADATRVLFNKTVGAASYATMPLAEDMDYGQEVFIKDLKGDAATNAITISFTGGELCDGLSEVTITTPYGWTRLTPTPGGGSWYMS